MISFKLILVTSDSATIMAENYRFFSKDLIPAFKSFAHVRSVVFLTSFDIGIGTVLPKYKVQFV